MSWSRVVQVDVGDAQSAVRISDADLEFTVHRSNVIGDNTAEVVVYNLSDTTVGRISQPGAGLVIRAGYEDKVPGDGQGTAGVIFLGNVHAVEDNRDGATRTTRLIAHAGRGDRKSWKTTSVSLTYQDGTSFDTILRDLADIMGYVGTGLDNASGVVCDGELTLSCKWLEACNQVARALLDAGVAVYLDLGELIVYPVEGPSVFAAVRLAESTGLLAASKVVEDGNPNDRKANGEAADPKPMIRFRSLLNWKLRPNCVIQVEGLTVQGTYVVETLDFRGDNMGGSFEAEGEASQ